MWLLNCNTSQLKNFILDGGTPAYAILSHTWGSEEVTFQHWQAAYYSDAQLGALPDDWKQRNLENLHRMAGYAKIAMCQEQALANGIEWVWVDTCCIDKQSSAELSEAINSMFRWYGQAEICYAYLRDVQGLEKLESSRWFKRGWTLQELLAPSNVIFYDQDWHYLGTRSELESLLESVTGIEVAYLRGMSLKSASVSKKMSWAAGRHTARVEDAAYSLLGLFDINLPLIYGEGEKAFRRLQEEIIRRNPEDHTLFAWGDIIDLEFQDLGDCIEDIPDLEEPHLNNGEATRLYGLLASSPSDFVNSRCIANHQKPSMFPNILGNAISIEHQPPSIVGEAVRIRFVSVKDMTYPYRYRVYPIVQQRLASLVWTYCVDFSIDTYRFYCLLTLPQGLAQRYVMCPVSRTTHLFRVSIPEHIFRRELYDPKTLRTFDIYPADERVLLKDAVTVTSLSYHGRSVYMADHRFDLNGAQEVDYRTFKSISSHNAAFSFSITETASASNAEGSITFEHRPGKLFLRGLDWQIVKEDTVGAELQVTHLATEFHSKWRLENGVYAKMRVMARGLSRGFGQIWAVKMMLIDP